jgi:hypothetical protein
MKTSSVDPVLLLEKLRTARFPKEFFGEIPETRPDGSKLSKGAFITKLSTEYWEILEPVFKETKNGHWFREKFHILSRWATRDCWHEKYNEETLFCLEIEIIVLDNVFMIMGPNECSLGFKYLDFGLLNNSLDSHLLNFKQDELHLFNCVTHLYRLGITHQERGGMLLTYLNNKTINWRLTTFDIPEVSKIMIKTNKYVYLEEFVKSTWSNASRK